MSSNIRAVPEGASGDAAQGPATFYSGAAYASDESIGLLMRHALGSFVRNVEDRMRHHDLTAMQWGPLLLLANGRADTVAACAREAGIDASAMTRMLDRLESKGLLSRTRSASDRRVVHVKLTTAGKRAAQRIPHEVASVLNHHLRGFSAAEFESFKDLLRRFERNAADFG